MRNIIQGFLGATPVESNNKPMYSFATREEALGSIAQFVLDAIESGRPYQAHLCELDDGRFSAFVIEPIDEGAQ